MSEIKIVTRKDILHRDKKLLLEDWDTEEAELRDCFMNISDIKKYVSDRRKINVQDGYILNEILSMIRSY
jgi:hypothetical protein